MKSKIRVLTISIVALLMLFGCSLSSYNAYAATDAEETTDIDSLIDFTITETVTFTGDGKSTELTAEPIVIECVEGDNKLSIDNIEATATEQWQLVSTSTDFAGMGRGSNMFAVNLNDGAEDHDMSSAFAPRTTLLSGESISYDVSGLIGARKTSFTDENLVDFVTTVTVIRPPEYALVLDNSANSTTDTTPMVFMRTWDEIAVEDTYNSDTYGELTITYLYSDFEDTEYSSASDIPWANERTSITSVTAEDRLFTTNTNYWFYYFNKATYFDLALLDTSQNTNMYQMFYHAGYNASTLNIVGLSEWNTSQVSNTDSMFYQTGYYASSFNIDSLSEWDTSSVQDMDNMFYFAGYKATDWSIGDLSNWNTSSAKYMSKMFSVAGYSATTWDIGDLSNWNVANVKYMNQMFYDSGYATTDWSIGDLSNWKTSNVTTMLSMFDGAGYNSETFDLGDIGSWDVSSVKTMDSMFYKSGYVAATWYIGDLSNWKTSKCTDMGNMFAYAGYKSETFDLGDLDNWNVSAVTDMTYTFGYAGTKAEDWNIGDLSSWNTAKVIYMYGTFAQVGGLNPDWTIGNLDNWNVSAVTTMAEMFVGAGGYVTSWSIGDLSSWDVSNVTSMKNMFAISGANSKSYNLKGLSSWDVSSVTDMTQMFLYTAALGEADSVELDVSNWNCSSLTTTSQMFGAAGAYASSFKITGLDTWTLSVLEDMSSMFASSGGLSTTWDIGDLSSWNVSTVKKMSSAFSGAGNSAEAWSIGDISEWDTSSATTMEKMFYKAGTSATTWDTLNLSSWDTSSVTNMRYMFDGSGVRVLNISSFDTSGTTYISNMFTDCNYLEEITLGEQFTFNGSGTESCILPYPSPNYISGATGKWYNKETYEAYDPADVLNNTAATYVAIPPYELYDITYELNGGTLDDTAVDYYASHYEVILPTPTRAGYSFDGWYETSDFTGDSISSIPINSTGDKTYYAKWTSLADYTFNYNANIVYGEYNTNNSSDTFEYTINDGVITGTCKRETGDGYSYLPLRVYLEANKTYKFSCESSGTWPSQTEAYLMKDGATAEAYYRMTSNDNYEFTPTVTGTYWIRLDVNTYGETHTFSNIEISPVIEGLVISYGQTESLTTEIPVRTGYTFAGWNTKEDGSGTMYSAGEAITNNLTQNTNVELFAQWESETYNITYNLNGGTLPTGALVTYTSDNEQALPTPTKEGNTFAGWYTTASFSGNSLTEIPKGYYGDVSLYAKWNANSYTITFDAYGGTTSTSSKTVTYSSTYGDLPTPTKEGDTFLGWYDNSTAKYDSSLYYKDHPYLYYADTYEDLYNAFGYDEDKLEEHYKNHGQAEGRQLAQYTSSTTVSTAGNQTLYAGWADTSKTAYALILNNSADSTNTTPMIFVKSYNPISAGDTYNSDTYGSLSVTAAYSDVESLSITKATNVPWYSYRTNITTVTVEDVVSPTSIAYWFSNFENCISVDVNNLNASKITDMTGAFWSTGMNSTSWVIDGIENWKTSSLQNMDGMFTQTGYNCTNIELDLSGWDVSNVTNMSNVFQGFGFYSSTISINMTSWNTENVTNMSGMFYGMGYSNLNSFKLTGISNWNTENVEDMSGMFGHIGNTGTSYTWDIGDISNWNTSKVTDMSDMFNLCAYKASSWSPGDLSTKEVQNSDGTKYMAWDVSAVKDMSGMFSEAGRYSSSWSIGDISSWNVSNVTTMETMFNGAATYASSFEIGDISCWETKNVTDMTKMFFMTGYYNASYYLDLSTWDVSNVTSYENFNKYVTTKVTAPTWVN